MSGVQDNMAGGGGVGQANGELFAVHILTDCVGVQHIFPENQVDLTVLQCHDPSLVVRDDLDGDLLNGWRFAPVVLVALKDGVLVSDEVGEHIGAGTDVAVDPVFGAAIDHAVGGDHGEGPDAGKLGEHGVVRLAHLDDEGVVVRGGHAHQQIHHLQPSVALTILQNGVEVGQDGVGVAGSAIGEGHAIPNVEGVGPAVLADSPVLSQAAHIALSGVTHQRVIKNALGIHLSGIQVGVQVPDIPVVDKDQLVPGAALTARRSVVGSGLVFCPLAASGQGS